MGTAGPSAEGFRAHVLGIVRPAEILRAAGDDPAHTTRVMRFCLSLVPRVSQTLAWLDERERARAAGFRFPVHRERFEARRIVRRVLLGDRLGVDPGALVVEEDGLGRPTIAGVSGLWWSTSHAQDVGVVAWSDAGPVGVDVAVWAQGQPADVLPVEQFLCAAEAQAFGAVPLEERAQASYAAWTAKEAVLKAMGVGLTVDPRRVDSGWRGDQFVPVPGGKGDQQIRCMGVVTEGRGSGTVCVAEGTGSGGAVEI